MENILDVEKILSKLDDSELEILFKNYKDAKEIIKRKLNRKLSKINKTLTELFGSDFDEFKKYVLSRRSRTTKIFKLKYGENLDKLNEIELQKEDEAIIKRIITEFKNGKRYIPTFDLFFSQNLKDLINGDFEEFKKYLLSRRPNTISIFKNKYGENLEDINEIDLTYDDKKLIEKIIIDFNNGKRIKEKKKRKTNEYKKLEEELGENFIDFKAYLLKKDETAINIFKKVYGENLDSLDISKITSEDALVIKRVFIGFKRRKNLKEQNLIEIFNEEFDEFKEYALSRSPHTIEIFKLKYGENLTELNKVILSVQDERTIKRIINEFKNGKRKIDDGIISNKKLQDLFTYEEFNEFKEYVFSRTPETIKIFKLRYGETLKEFNTCKLTNNNKNTIYRIIYEFKNGKRKCDNKSILDKHLQEIFTLEEFEEFKKYVLSRTPEIIKLYKLRYGENLDELNDLNLTNSNKIAIYRIIREFKNGKRFNDTESLNIDQNLSELFGEDILMFKEYVLSRSVSTVNVFRKKYGENLEELNNSNLSKKENVIVRRIINEFKGGKRYKPKTDDIYFSKNLKDLITGDFEEFKEYVLSRRHNTISLFERKYGETLEELNDVDLTYGNKKLIQSIISDFNSGKRKTNKRKESKRKRDFTSKNLEEIFGENLIYFKEYVLKKDEATIKTFKKIYGENLDSLDISQITPEDTLVIKRVITSFRKRKILKEANLPEIFKEDFEDFRDYIFSRSDSIIDAYRKKYGENLDTVNDVKLNTKETKDIYRMKWLFRSGERQKKTYLNTLLTETYGENFNIFRNYVFSRSNLIINTFRKKYGENLSEVTDCELNRKEKQIIYNIKTEFEKFIANNRLKKSTTIKLEEKTSPKKKTERKIENINLKNNDSFLNIYFKLYGTEFTSLFTEPDTALYLLKTAFSEERNNIITGYQSLIDQKNSINLLINKIRRKIAQLKSKRAVYILGLPLLYKLFDLGLDKNNKVEILSKIPSDMIRILYKAFGSNLEKVCLNDLTNKETILLTNIVIPYVITEIINYYKINDPAKAEEILKKIESVPNYDSDSKKDQGNEEKTKKTRAKKQSKDVTTRQANLNKFLEEFEKNYKVSFEEYFKGDLDYEFILTNVFNLYVINISLGLSKNIPGDFKILENELKRLESNLKDIKVDGKQSLKDILYTLDFNQMALNKIVFDKLSKTMQEKIITAYGRNFNENYLEVLEEDEQKLLLNVVIPYYIFKLKEEYAKRNKHISSAHESQNKISEYSDISFLKDFSKKYQ